MNGFNTITVPGQGEYEEKKSRFLANAYPVKTQEEIRTHLEKLKKQYYDARHHCYAWVLGLQGADRKASDDGEPHGTAGLPILKVIDGAKCTDIMIVVTRYFGGTLLGTGGLVRAYTQAAKAALENAGIVTMQEGAELVLSLDYPLLDRVLYLLSQEGLTAGETLYTHRVQMSVLTPAVSQERLCRALLALGNGKIEITVREKGFYAFS